MGICSNFAATAKLLQLCLTLCNCIDGSPPGFPVLGILQARTPEWVAISFSNAWKWKVKIESEVPQSCPALLSRVQLLATPWTAAYEAPPSMVFSRQEYWSGVQLPSPYNHEIWPHYIMHNIILKNLWYKNFKIQHTIRWSKKQNIKNYVFVTSKYLKMVTNAYIWDARLWVISLILHFFFQNKCAFFKLKDFCYRALTQLFPPIIIIIALLLPFLP